MRKKADIPGFGAGAFTLGELMVSVAILSLILVMTVQIIGSTGHVWQHTRAKIDAFQEARAGFESMTRRLSQATLNTYWDYDSANGPSSYVRQSELHFINGNASDLLSTVTTSSGSALQSATHCVFFQAPLGYSSDTTSGVTLDRLLNACGYYVEFADDTASRPRFLQSNSTVQARRRFRLMELTQPTENFSVYQATATANPSQSQLRAWFISPLQSATPPVHVLAENVIALILLPQYSPNDVIASGSAVLSSDYSYDSKNAARTDTHNQLPPMVQVTMVAIDEASALRLAQRNGVAPPDFGLGNRFKQSDQYLTDLQALEKNLVSQKVTYRVFSTNVPILQAKWSSNP